MTGHGLALVIVGVGLGLLSAQFAGGWLEHVRAAVAAGDLAKLAADDTGHGAIGQQRRVDGTGAVDIGAVRHQYGHAARVDARLAWAREQRQRCR